MNNKRYSDISHRKEKLSIQEIADGWHFCFDSDYQLVGPGMEDNEYCTCDLTVIISTSENNLKLLKDETP